MTVNFDRPYPCKKQYPEMYKDILTDAQKKEFENAFCFDLNKIYDLIEREDTDGVVLENFRTRSKNYEIWGDMKNCVKPYNGNAICNYFRLEFAFEPKEYMDKLGATFKVWDYDKQITCTKATDVLTLEAAGNKQNFAMIFYFISPVPNLDYFNDKWKAVIDTQPIYMLDKNVVSYNAFYLHQMNIIDTPRSIGLSSTKVMSDGSKDSIMLGLDSFTTQKYAEPQGIAHYFHFGMTNKHIQIERNYPN